MKHITGGCCLWLLMLCGAAAIATAAPPTITGPEKVYAEAGDWAELKVDTTGKWVRFRSLDTGLKTFPADKLKDTKSTLVQGKAGKKYRVLAYTGNDDGGSEIEIIVVFGPQIPPDADIDPVPIPKPKPIPVPPEPEPVVGEFWVIVVEETAQRTPAIARVIGDFAFWKTLPAADVLLYDKDSPDCKKYKYDILAKQAKDSDGKLIPLPVIMIIDDKGKLIKASPLLSDTAGVRKFVKDSTGK